MANSNTIDNVTSKRKGGHQQVNHSRRPEVRLVVKRARVMSTKLHRKTGESPFPTSLKIPFRSQTRSNVWKCI